MTNFDVRVGKQVVVTLIIVKNKGLSSLTIILEVDFMSVCERCGNEIGGTSMFKARRKDGTAVILCQDCANEWKAIRQQRKAEQGASFGKEAVSAPKTKESVEDEKWYKTIGSGVLVLLFTLFLFYELTGLEAGRVSSVRVWVPIVFLYNALGIWGAVACPGLFSLYLFGLGFKKFLDEENNNNR